MANTPILGVGESGVAGFEYKLVSTTTSVPDVNSGELGVSNADPSKIQFMNISTTSIEGIVGPTPSRGDTIQIGGNRFYISANPIEILDMWKMSVAFDSGTDEYVVGKVYEIIMYPSDARKLNKDKGQATGGLGVDGDLKVTNGKIYIDGSPLAPTAEEVEALKLQVNALQEEVDDIVPVVTSTSTISGINFKGMVTTGTAASPNLKKGQLYFNTSSFMLMVGK